MNLLLYQGAGTDILHARLYKKSQTDVAFCEKLWYDVIEQMLEGAKRHGKAIQNAKARL